MFTILQIICRLLSLFLLIVTNDRYDPPTIRRTLYGPVEGTTEISVFGQEYYAFKGIPFAEVPISGRDPYTGEQVDRRFKAPEPLKRQWTKPLKVQKFSNLCVPTMPFSENLIHLYDFSEDCLYLDVFVPADGVEKKPVLVFIHGVGEAGGTSDEKILGPDFLLSQDCIVVKLAYRSGMFGWLNLGHGNYTGNMSLKDQQLGMKWVYENIENFSGNKEAILLFGHSLGAEYVNYHMLNTVSQRYFTRAFCMSGTSFNPFYNLDKNNQLQLAKKCFQINDTDKLVGFLRTASRISLFKCNLLGTGDKVWLPTIESPDASEAFLTKTPNKIYNSNEAPVLDTMFSIVNQEGIRVNTSVVDLKQPLLQTDWQKTYIDIILPFEGFTRESYPKEYKQAVDLLRMDYFTDITNVEAIQTENIAFFSDLNLCFSALKAVKLQIKANNNNRNNKSGKNKKTYFFRFSVNTDINPIRIAHNVNYTGATHADELSYTFYFTAANFYGDHLKRKDHVYDIIMRTVKYITNFARTGDPTIDRETPFTNCESPDKIFCTEISNDLKSFIMTDIEKQLHYETWLEVEKIYETIN